MLFFQLAYKEDVKELLAGKESVSDGIGSTEFIQIILFTSAIFFLISFCMVVFMICKRKYKIKQKIRETRLIERYQNFLSGFLILPIDEAFLGIQKSEDNEYRLEPKDISNPKRRGILAREIYLLKKDLDGQQANQLTNYFYGLGLQRDVMNMLQSVHWTKKVSAIQMADAFGIQESLSSIQKYIHHKNRDLAIHAILAIMSMQKSSAILNEVNTELNDWECHKIIDMLKKLNISESKKMNILELASQKDSPLKRLQKGILEEKIFSQQGYQFA